ncbi:hypothetical protein M422DRAFT_272797 [Sphaerobolus stellatus SS14]|uniref:DUF6534 domain-containing protein n=1 Tax=Sphaerobolus stellatus (strain SS14) TaxID=990650 RepID=A0A0C9ULL2_SPHS4|nr:hypothetical protein M422DRAFT_272797 [Sphaerobolus stellatus SS14]
MSELMLLEELLVSLTQGGQSVLIGIPVLAVMWAIGVSQTHRYYKTYREDPMLLKYFVGSCLIMSTIIFSGFCFAFYYWVIYCRLPSHYTALPAIIVTPGLALSCYTTVFLPVAVQSFYALRVWVLSGKNTYLALILIITTLTSAVTGVSAYCFRLIIQIVTKHFATSIVLVRLDVGGSVIIIYDHFCRVVQTISFACSVACDITISLSLAFFLNRRKKEGIKSTQSAVLRLMLYALNIGLITSIFTLVNVVTWRTTSPERFTWVIFYSWTGGIYFNSVLVSLNARASIRSRLNAHIPTTLGRSLLVFDIDGTTPDDDIQLELSSIPL